MNKKSARSKILPTLVAGILCATHAMLSNSWAADVRGSQSGRWTAANSPYIVTGEIMVPDGQTLSIEPGVVVRFAGFYSLRVYGALRVLGTPTSRVVFTSANDREFAGTLRPPTAPATKGDWAGIEFTSSALGEQSRMENCLIKYANQPLALLQVTPQKLESITISDCGSATVTINGKAVPFKDGAEQDYTLAAQGGQISAPLASLDAGAATPAAPALDFGEMEVDKFFDLHGELDVEFEVDQKNNTVFDLHNLELFFNFNITKRATVLAEVDFEDGAAIGENEFEGKIALERAEIKLKLNKNLTFIAGRSLTPYGIYNQIRFAEPSFVFDRLPFAIYGFHPNARGVMENDLPEHITGVQLQGEFPVSEGEIDAYAYVANDRGVAPAERVRLRTAHATVGFRARYIDGLGRFKFGGSFYNGRDFLNGNSDQRLIGADLEIDIGKFVFQTEATMNKFDRLNANAVKLGTQRTALGYYTMGSVSLFEGHLSPFLRYDFYNPDVDAEATGDDSNETSLGFNWRAVKDVYIKAEHHFRGGNQNGFLRNDAFDLSFAVAF